MARDAVQRAFDWLGREHGFTRRSGDLFKESDEVVAVLDLQRSDYVRVYYINVGFALRQLHDGPVTRFGLCDIRLRAEVLVSTGEDLQQLLDLETDFDEETREAELRQALEERLLPVIDAALTIEGLGELDQSGSLRRGFVRKEARALLAVRRSSPKDLPEA
jgi:hypothetical protein